MNKFQFLGRLTKDPETRVIATTGSQVASFALAVNRKFVAQNGERQADFFNLTAFGKTAEFCSKYFRKGQQVLVEGRIQNRTWEDQTGARRYSTDFVVESAYFADSKRDGVDVGTGTGTGASTLQVPGSTEAGDFITIEETEELPF